MISRVAKWRVGERINHKTRGVGLILECFRETKGKAIWYTVEIREPHHVFRISDCESNFKDCEE